MLKCCYKKHCVHPFGNPVSLQWFPGGPDVTHVPLPIADPDQPWGSKSVTMNAMAQVKRQDFLLCQSHHWLLYAFQKLKGEPSSEFIEDLAKNVYCLLLRCHFGLNIYSKFKRTKKRGGLKLLPLGDVRGNKHALMKIQQWNPQHLYAALYVENCMKIMVISNGCITITVEPDKYQCQQNACFFFSYNYVIP